MNNILNEMTETQEIKSLINREVVLAMGCTEPVAVALAVTKSRETLGTIPDKVEVNLSKNIFKNAMGVGIPGTGMIGLPIAIAMGIVAGDSSRALEVLDIPATEVEKSKQWLENNKENLSIQIKETTEKLKSIENTDRFYKKPDNSVGTFKYELPVAEVIGSNMWVSFAIAVIATILQFAIAIPLGITSATHQYSKRDYAVTVFTMIGIALPTYFFAAIIVKVFSVQLGWFPSSGLISAGKVYTDDLSGFVSKYFFIFVI